MVFGDKGLRRRRGKPPGQNSPSAANCPNTGSRVCLGRVQSRRRPESKVIFTFSEPPRTTRGCLTLDARAGMQTWGLSRSLGGGGESKLFPRLLGTIEAVQGKLEMKAWSVPAGCPAQPGNQWALASLQTEAVEGCWFSDFPGAVLLREQSILGVTLLCKDAFQAGGAPLRCAGANRDRRPLQEDLWC